MKVNGFAYFGMQCGIFRIPEEKNILDTEAMMKTLNVDHVPVALVKHFDVPKADDLLGVTDTGITREMYPNEKRSLKVREFKDINGGIWYVNDVYYKDFLKPFLYFRVHDRKIYAYDENHVPLTVVCTIKPKEDK